MSHLAVPVLWVHRPVIEHLCVLPRRPWEVGGWLLGFWTGDEQALFVTHATPPSRRGTPFGVWIDGNGHRERFDAAWAASGGHVTFLGDWHTHPGCAAVPSTRDRRAARQLSADPDFGTPKPLLGIVQAPRWRRSRVRDLVRWHLGGPDGMEELEPTITDALPEAATTVASWSWPRR